MKTLSAQHHRILNDLRQGWVLAESPDGSGYLVSPHTVEETANGPDKGKQVHVRLFMAETTVQEFLDACEDTVLNSVTVNGDITEYTALHETAKELVDSLATVEA